MIYFSCRGIGAEVNIGNDMKQMLNYWLAVPTHMDQQTYKSRTQQKRTFIVFVLLESGRLRLCLLFLSASERTLDKVGPTAGRLIQNITILKGCNNISLMLIFMSSSVNV